MLSYRHSYHAGNHADVLKHLVLFHALKYMTIKDKPLCYIDSHAGAGAYSLDSAESQKTQEYLDGIARLWAADKLPESLRDFVSMTQGFNQNEHAYPGSPWIAAHCLRAQDRLFLHDLHRSEIPTLQALFANDQRVNIAQENGFQRVVALCPPPEKRGLVLMDPSYEIKSDYQDVFKTLDKGLKRFATGVYMIWYPVVDRQRIDKLEKQLASLGLGEKAQLFELSPRADSKGLGMTGSGMIVVNPPWKLKESMAEALPFLSKLLGVNGAGSYRVIESL